ncbi:NUDIX domain-containing protein [Paraburkholderia sp. A3RO-2L]|jgi:8-oxo-dGTP pyrophosphatase MutT (NUDIX family)|uniref:NUDIX domain-containing protein n=1 Tax=unclassified Paraburkholderia TaxID=2615204 RepID=UPI003DA7B421
MTAQFCGHLNGPAAPHIAFWYGDTYLGETRGHPDDVEGAKARLMRQIRILEPVDNAARMMGQLEQYTEAKVVCGSAVTPIRTPARSADLLRRLRHAGFSLDRGADPWTPYVLTVIHDPVRDLVVGLLKNRGPAFLIGKLTFPGGKTNPGEPVEQAASRELLEEAAVHIPVDAWTFVCRSSALTVLAASSDNVLRARQAEDEEVFVMNVTRQLEYARQKPEQYSPDFIVILEAALATLG